MSHPARAKMLADEPARPARSFVSKLLRFPVVGALSSALYAASTWFYIAHLGLDENVAAFAGYATAIPFSFLGHRNFTFGSRGGAPGELVRFVVVHAAGMLVAWASMQASSRLGLHYAVGILAAVVLVPLVRSLEAKLGVAPYGVGIFTASLVLAIMIIPYAASLGRELIQMVPSALKEGAYALGATRYEVLRYVILPHTKSGLFAGLLLSLGRALGETMAVTMVIGNSSLMPTSIFAPSNTMASVIANEFTEADRTVYLSALIELGLVLFIVTVVVNILGKVIIKRFANE